jgi:hypothetical protein
MNTIHVYSIFVPAVQSDHFLRAQLVYLTCVGGKNLLKVPNQSSFISLPLTVLPDSFNNGSFRWKTVPLLSTVRFQALKKNKFQIGIKVDTPFGGHPMS